MDHDSYHDELDRVLRRAINAATQAEIYREHIRLIMAADNMRAMAEAIVAGQRNGVKPRRAKFGR